MPWYGNVHYDYYIFFYSNGRRDPTLVLLSMRVPDLHTNTRTLVQRGYENGSRVEMVCVCWKRIYRAFGLLFKSINVPE